VVWKGPDLPDYVTAITGGAAPGKLGKRLEKYVYVWNEKFFRARSTRLFISHDPVDKRWTIHIADELEKPESVLDALE
jgi:hypothetical protein